MKLKWMLQMSVIWKKFDCWRWINIFRYAYGFLALKILSVEFNALYLDYYSQHTINKTRVENYENSTHQL